MHKLCIQICLYLFYTLVTSDVATKSTSTNNKTKIPITKRLLFGNDEIPNMFSDFKRLTRFNKPKH